MRMDVLMILLTAYGLVLMVWGGGSAVSGIFKKKTFESHAEFLKALREEEEARMKKIRDEELYKEGKAK